MTKKPSTDNFPRMTTLFKSELGAEVSDELYDTLHFFWPECYESSWSGKVIMTPKDATQLETLCRRFGVPMKVSENSLAVLSRAYEVFHLTLGCFVDRRLFRPEVFLSNPEGWPQPWLDYIDAVVRGDEVAARALAIQLQPLAPECQFPPGVIPYAKPQPHLPDEHG